MKYKQLTNVKIELPNKKKNKKKKALGYQYFSEPYANIFLCAKKKSGKTTLIYNLIKNTINSGTTIIFFVSTFYNDETYQYIQDYLTKKKIPFKVYTSLYHDAGNVKINMLDTILKSFELNAVSKNSQKTKDFDLAYIKLNKTYPQKKRTREYKFIVPEYLFIFDDISAELRYNHPFSKLLKQNRHYKSKVIVSSQFYKDIEPTARANLDYILLFKNIPDDTLKDIYDELQLNNLSFDEFKQIYMDVHEEPYNFLYISTNDGELRKNFDKEIVY